MKTNRVGIFVVAAFAGLTLQAAAAAAAADAPAARSDRERPEEFVVTAKALQDLRLKIKLAENEVYARFNDLNSDDSHDIHCYDRAPVGSHIPRRWCVSNAWRQADANIADAYVRGLQSASSAEGGKGGGSYGSIPGKYRANQLRMEQLIMKELGQLAHEDPALREALQRVGQAHLALEAVTGSGPEYTLYRDVTAGDEGLPFGAKRLVEVRVGEVAWNHPLTARTFTIGSVTGHIRGLRLRCDRFDKNLDYEAEAEWTVPDAWSDCALLVKAKPGTTFALYEF